MRRESTHGTSQRYADKMLQQRLEVARHSANGLMETYAPYNQHFTDFLKLHRSVSQTYKSYKGVLKLFVEFLQCRYPRIQYLHEIILCPKLFDDYKVWLKGDKLTPEGKPHKDWTVKNHLKVLKTVFKRAKEWRAIQEMPIIHTDDISITDAKIIVTLSKEEDFELFFSRCKEMKAEYYPHYFITARTGIRFGEMCYLMWDDVNLEDRYIIIRSHSGFNPKGRSKKTGKPRERTIPLTEDAVAVLKGIPRSNKYGNVFLKDGKPIQKNDKSFRRWIIAIVRGTRLQGMTRFHELRHTVGHILADRGTPRETIADILGHSDIRTTECYVGKPQQPKINAVNNLEGFGAKCYTT